MSRLAGSFLPSTDRGLLRTVATIVPLGERDDWLRTWEAELWHARYGVHGTRIVPRNTTLSAGLIRDALWLRSDDWRRTCSGTPALCIASLMGLCLAAMSLAALLAGSWHPFGGVVIEQLKRSLIGAPLVVFVTFATAYGRYAAQRSAGGRLYWLQRQLFHAAKTTLVLVLTFLLSADLCGPMHATLPNVADLLQLLCFVVFALLGMRWSVRDQELRCKQCLHTLANPARVGRPSHNLLEWNGTELLCKQGHGLLSVSEMETSWCASSRWSDQPSIWSRGREALAE